jgi:hypothetical protein
MFKYNDVYIMYMWRICVSMHRGYGLNKYAYEFAPNHDVH